MNPVEKHLVMITLCSMFIAIMMFVIVYELTQIIDAMRSMR